jgi:hypothetical protein
MENYYDRFTSDEIQLIMDKQNAFHELHGMYQMLYFVEKELGKVHNVTCELRKMCNKQNEKLNDIEYPDTLVDKIFKVNEIVNKFDEDEVLFLMKKAYDQAFRKYDVVEAGLEGREDDIECAWILGKYIKEKNGNKI